MSDSEWWLLEIGRHVPQRAQDDAVAVDRPLAHNLAVVGGQRAGDLHRRDAVRAAQRPPAEILVALADDDAVVVVELCSSFVCSASSTSPSSRVTASAGK
jgi:hypothetical protein